MDDGGLEVVGDDADDDEEEEDGVVFGVWLVGEDEAIVGVGLPLAEEGLAWMFGGQSRRLDARGFLPGRGRSLSLSVEMEAVDLVVKVVRM